MTKRLLFVDDERSILDGLRRLLRRHRREWDMTFAEGAGAALDILADSSFDVVISDMRMPGLDGAALLEQVREDHPSTIRIILSGQSELEAALRAVPVAHQFLSKPCEPTVLHDVITRSCALHDLLTNDLLRRTVGQIDSLPTLPRIYSELTNSLAKEEVCLDEVASIVEQDAAITAKILQLVNSGFFGLARRITSVREATTYLGLNMLKSVTISLEVFREFDQCKAPADLSMEREQAHASLCARVSRHVATGKITREHAFTAAMLHDIGKMIFATKMPQEYQHILEAARNSPHTLYVVEEERYGISHAELGAYLLGLWGMPYPIVEAVANHHHPARVPQERFDCLGAVHVADALVRDMSLIDTDYVSSMNIGQQLPSWIEKARLEIESDS